MPKRSRSLALTVSIAIVTLSVLTLSVASGFELFINFKNQQKIVAARQQIIAEKAADTVRAFIHEKKVLLSVCARVGNLATASMEEKRKTLEKLLGIEPAF